MPVKPFSPLLGFPVTFSRIGLGSLSVSRLPLEAVFWVFGGGPAARSRDRFWFLASGVGLGGGYCTPQNQK